jgi:hypothetical protein
MATRKASRSTGVTIAFEALSIEGGLLSPEWLSRVAQREAPDQAEADYRVPKGLGLRDEIGRFWRIAQAHHRELVVARAAGARQKERADRFVNGLLSESLGFASLAPAAPVEIGGRSYPVGFAALGGRVPVVVGPDGGGLDTLDPGFGDGTRRRSPFGLAQEFLNAEEGALWGVASDGATLRILRDNASLTRPSWVEADLDRIFAEERYADFAALWLLAHETRFGRPGQPARDCPLEAWREAGREEGTRAREHLRGGVEEALLALGQGFLQHPANGTLRAALQGGTLAKRDYFQELLRLAYRLIFLLTVEERGLLHPDGASDATRKLYGEGYGLRHLAERSLRRSAHDRYSDLWDGLTVVFRGLAAGEPRLGLPALAGLFAPDQCPSLDSARLENRHLLHAVFRLAWLRESTGLSRVNWRDMGPEELGSVYESLLELVPQVTEEARAFSFATGAETKGNARKTSGSYYTPDSLFRCFDSASTRSSRRRSRRMPASRPPPRPKRFLGLGRRPRPRLGPLPPSSRPAPRRADRAPRGRGRPPRRLPPRPPAGRQPVDLRRRPEPDGRRTLQGEPSGWKRSSRASRSPSSTRTSSTATPSSERPRPGWRRDSRRRLGSHRGGRPEGGERPQEAEQGGRRRAAFARDALDERGRG